MFGRERRRDPFCSECGCPMYEIVVRYDLYFDPRTGVGTKVLRKAWVCSSPDRDRNPFDWHDEFEFGPKYKIPAKAYCS